MRTIAALTALGCGIACIGISLYYLWHEDTFTGLMFQAAFMLCVGVLMVIPRSRP